MTAVINLADVKNRVFVTTTTPFAPDGDLALDNVERQCDFLIDSGIEFLVTCGNTGEFTSLTTEEIKRVTRATADVVGNRAYLVAGVGGPGRTAVELAEHAQEVGATSIMIHHPTHTFVDRIALRRYYDQIISSIDIGVIPYKRGPELTDDLLSELVGDPKVIGVKYAVNDLPAFSRLANSLSAEAAWICGTAESWAPFFYLAGASGFSSGLANFAPNLSLELFEALESRRYDDAMLLREFILPLEELRANEFGAYNVSAIKEAMHQMGLSDRVVREPIRVLDTQSRALIAQFLKDRALLA